MDIYKARPVNFHRTVTENLHKAHEEHRTAATICYTITAIGTGTLAALDKTVESVGRIPLTLISPISFNARFKQEFTAEKLVATIKQIFTDSVGVVLAAFNHDPVQQPLLPTGVEVPVIPEKQKTQEERQAKVISQFNEKLTTYCNKLIAANQYNQPEALAELRQTKALIQELELACHTDSTPFESREAAVAAIVRSVTGELEKLALAQALVANRISLLSSDLSSDEISEFMQAITSLDANSDPNNDARASLIFAAKSAYDTINGWMLRFNNEHFTLRTSELDEKRLAIFRALLTTFSDSDKEQFFYSSLINHDYNALKLLFDLGFEYSLNLADNFDESDLMTYLQKDEKNKRIFGTITKSTYKDYYALKNIFKLFVDKGLFSKSDEEIRTKITKTFCPVDGLLLNILNSPLCDADDIEVVVLNQTGGVASAQLGSLFSYAVYAIKRNDENDPHCIAAIVLLENLDKFSEINQLLVKENAKVVLDLLKKFASEN